ncbi:hypothetical protein M9458_042154, partial [Cirrhinus mrigala]
RAKHPLSKDVNDLFLRRRKQEAVRNEVLEFTKDQSSCNVRMRWERNTQRRMVSATISRYLQEAREQYQMDIDERRERLREMLEEMEAKKETVSERQAKMLERATTLRERRENERQRLVAEKLDQLFREQCEELRAVQMKRRQDEVCTECAAQVRTKEEVQRMQQEEDRLDRQAKEERHNQEIQRQRENNLQQKTFLQTQIEMTEQQRIQAKQLKQEEAQLL